MRPRALLLLSLAAPVSLLTLAGCSSETADTTVAVTGTADACKLAKDVLPAGSIAFEFTNKADDVNELYVLTKSGDTMHEVENVTTGTTRTLTVELAAGHYQVRCKPGQTGKGISSPFEVAGKGGQAAATNTKADRTVTFEAVDFSYSKLDLAGLTAGKTVRFEMVNSGTQAHEFEVLGPDGKAVGEIAGVEPGGRGAAVVTLSEPGTYTYRCILKDTDSHMGHDTKGMKGTFEVASS